MLTQCHVNIACDCHMPVFRARHGKSLAAYEFMSFGLISLPSQIVSSGHNGSISSLFHGRNSLNSLPSLSQYNRTMHKPEYFAINYIAV